MWNNLLVAQLLLLLNSSTILAQRPHRQSRLEQIGEPEQVSSYRTRYHSDSEVTFALLNPDVALDGGVEEDDFELVLRDGVTLRFEGLELHDNEQEPSFKYWTRENEDMTSILLVYTDSVFGSQGVRGIIQNATSGMNYEFSADVEGMTLTNLDIDEITKFDEELDPETRDETNMGGSEMDENFPTIVIDGVDEPPDDAEALASRALSSSVQLRGSVDDNEEYGRRLADDSGSILDVLVCLTPSAMCAIANQNSNCQNSEYNMKEVEVFLNTVFSNTNEAYRESAIQTRIRLVYFYVDNDINENNGEWTTILSQFSNNPSVIEQRNKYGADFATLLINKPGYCGIGWRPDTEAQIQEYVGYSVTQWDCAASNLSYGHEVAHNMGCNHNRENAPRPAPPGAYNYGYQDPNRQFRSIMSYSCGSTCTRIRRFSGDKSFTSNGKSVGNAGGENNAKWIQRNLSKYAKFRNMVVPLGPTSPPPPPPPPPPKRGIPATPAPIPATPAPIPATPAPVPNVKRPGPQPQQNARKKLNANTVGGWSGADGNMFDVKPKKDMQITNFHVMTDVSGLSVVELYKLKTGGTFKGKQFDMKKWELVGTVRFEGKARQITTLKDNWFAPIQLKKNRIQAFYITHKWPRTSNNMYAGGKKVGRLHSSDGNLEFFEGIAINHPARGRVRSQWSPRVWCGTIEYQLGSSRSDSETLNLPVPTAAPTTNDRSIGGGTTTTAIEPVRTETTFEGGSGQAGSMFVLHSTAENPVILDSFDFHTFSIEEVDVIVYTMEGSFELKPGSDQDESLWAKIADTRVVGAGSPNATRIPTSDVFAPVTIPPGTNQSFYISMKETKMRYTTGILDESEQTGPIKVLASVGKEYFFGQSFTPRIWNGAFYWREIKGGGGDVGGGGEGGGGDSIEVSADIPKGYTLSWGDDFNGKEINKDNWSKGLVYDVDRSQHILWNKREGGPHLLNAKYDGYIRDEDAYLEDGKLMLANREHKPALIMQEGQFQYSTGWVNSLHKRFFNGSKKGVYLEVRAKFPEGPKVWPAIWLVAERFEWPPEIDIWEYFGVFYKPQWGIDEMHLRNIWGHWQDKKTHNIEVHYHQEYSGFKTFGWLWTSESMTWYIDGEEIATKVKGVDVPNDGWPNEDMCLILNNGLMSEVSADLEVEGVKTTFPNYLEIDYLAVYEDSGGEGGGGEEEGKPGGGEEEKSGGEETTGEYVLFLGEAGESCSSACSRNGAKCTKSSLLHGDALGTVSKIAATAASVGTSCDGGMHSEEDWDVNPQVSSEAFCFPAKARTNQNCDATSTLEDEDGNLHGHRICACEEAEGSGNVGEIGNVITRFHTTTFANGNGATGAMFNIKAKKDITVTNFHVHTLFEGEKKAEIEIYALKDPNESFSDYVKDGESWDLIGEAMVEGQGTGNPTPLPEGSIKMPKEIGAGEIQAFYISIIGGGMKYTTGAENLALFNDCEDLEFYVGVGIGGARFNGRVFEPRVFNGIIEYTLVSSSAEDMLDEGQSLVEAMEDATFSYPPGEKGEGWPCASDEECASNQCSAETTDAAPADLYIDGINPPPDLDQYDYGLGGRRRVEAQARWCLNEDGMHDEDGASF